MEKNALVIYLMMLIQRPIYNSPLSHDITLVKSDMTTHSLVPAFNPHMYLSRNPDIFQVVVPLCNSQSQKSISNDSTFLCS